MVPSKHIWLWNLFFLEYLLGLFKGHIEDKLDVLVRRSIDLVLELNSKTFMKLDLHIYFDVS